MKNRKKSLSRLFLSASLALGLSSTQASADALQQQAKALFAPLPTTMPGSASDTAERIALGEKLYRDTRLSINNTQSCNSCHDVAKGGDDGEVTSPGAAGKRGGRNSPTVLNAGLQISQFWDGRAKDLFEQAKGPILNPIEMGMPDGETVVAKLSATEEYPALFEAAFGPDSLSYDNIAEAIAAFERTLITRDRFDAYLKGDLNALDSTEKQGLQTFIAKGCAGCHSGALLGGQMYMKMGLVKPYSNQQDRGRIDVTGSAADDMVFKVPMLRNIAMTAPYFHDGAAATLEEAVKVMGELQVGQTLSAQETSMIVEFLNSLSGTLEQ